MGQQTTACRPLFLLLFYGSCFVLCFCFFATPRGLWDLSSPTRGGTRVPCSESAESYHQGPPRNSWQLPVFSWPAKFYSLHGFYISNSFHPYSFYIFVMVTVFEFFNRWKESKDSILVTPENDMKFRFQGRSIKFYWHMAVPGCIQII